MPFDLEESRIVAEIRRKLLDLPTQAAPPIDWAQFKQRQLLKRTRSHRATRRQMTLIATVVIVMIGALAILRDLASLPGAERQARLPVMPLEYRAVPAAWDEAQARSAASERWLAALPEEPVIVRVGTREAVTHLEDRIAWVDDTLTSVRAEAGDGERARALQFERDRLVNSLAQVRYAETLAADLP